MTRFVMAALAAALSLWEAAPSHAQQTAQPSLVRLREDQPVDRPARANSVAVRAVTIENVSGQAVELSIIETSCPTLDAALERQTLGPGESTPLRLVMRTAEVGGRQSYTAVVEARAPGADSTIKRQRIGVELAYTLAVVSVVHPQNASLYAAGDGVSQCDLIVRDLEGEAVTVNAVLTPGPWIDAGRGKAISKDGSLMAVTLESRPSAPGLYRGVVEVNTAADPVGSHRINVSLRIDPALTPEPPGLIWRENGGRWSVQAQAITLTPNRMTRSAPVPARARVRGALGVVEVGELSRPDPAVDRWVLASGFDAGKLGDEARHGSRTIEVLDASGAVLCTVPVLWFSSETLRKP